MTFGDYTGTALLVESLGSITGGALAITGADTTLSGGAPGSDLALLSGGPALILRAGLSALTNQANLPQTLGGTPFSSVGVPSLPGSITVRDLNTNDQGQGDAGPVILSALGDITTGAIDTNDQGPGNAGSVTITSTGGNIINTGTITASDQGPGAPGSVTLTALGTITSGVIDTGDQGPGANTPGSITILPGTGSIPTNSPDGGATNPAGGGTTNLPDGGTTNPPAGGTSNPAGGGTTNSPDGGTTNLPDGGVTNPPDGGTTNPPGGDLNVGDDAGNQTNDDDNVGLLSLLDSEQQPHSPQTDSNVLLGQPSTKNDPVSGLEGSFTQEFEDYLKRSLKTETFTQADVRNWTDELEQATGVKTGVIYAKFLPTSATQSETECESQSTPEAPSPELEQRFGYRRFELQEQSGSCLSTQNDQLELVMVTAEGETLRKRVAGASRAKVLATTQEFQRAVTNPRNTRYLNSAQQLYRWLVAPLDAELQARDVESLVFAMDTGLRSVPLAALHDGQGFLAERYSVSLVPSLSLTTSRYRDPRPLKVLAMGASEFADRPPLPGVRVELATITEQLWQGKSFLNNTFTLENFKAQRRQQRFEIVHFATHAEFKPGSPSNSYIQLWDRKLRLDQLDELRLFDPPVELLVLSACRTALGDKDSELGFAGLAVQSGANSTLATLWNVSDRGTLGLMAEFYHQLSQVPIKSEALRQAQLAMIHGVVRVENNQLYNSGKRVILPPELSAAGTQNLSHPYYWAAFTLVGEPR